MLSEICRDGPSGYGSDRKLVIITGLIGSGKTELVGKLVSGDGFEPRNIGNELARIYRLRYGLPDNEAVPGLARMGVHKAVRRNDPDYFFRYITEEPYERRVIDGLRNYRDAVRATELGARIIALVAPRAVRFDRCQYRDSIKDPSIDEMTMREERELDDPDPDGAQAIQVMRLADTHGLTIDATQEAETVYEKVVHHLML